MNHYPHRDLPLPVRGWPLLLGICSLAAVVWAEDVVVVSRVEPPGELRRSGIIQDFTGKGLTLRLPGDRDEQIEPSRIVGYETELVPDQRHADQLFAEGRYADAAVSYLRAVEAEKRVWMRRVILARLTRCYANMGQVARAGDTFLLILGSDPTTQLLDALPLAWTTAQPRADVVDRAGRWMDDARVPAARLLGASWLMTTPQRARALETLAKLASDEDPRIATLAEAQAWRDRLVTVSREDVRRWQAQLEQLDPSLRAGPSLLVGQALARHNEHAEAALALLRIPILYPLERELAAEALFAAAEQLDKSGDPAGARTLLRELIREHGDHPLVPLAEQRLGREQVD